MSSENKVALVTGSTSGIGLAVAHALAKRGVNIIVTGSRDVSLVGDTLDELRSYGVLVNYFSADLSKRANVDTLWSQVVLLYPDGVDILVNNAARPYAAPIEDHSDDKWDYSMAVMLSAAYYLIRRSLPAMKKKGWGRIINMSSIYGFVACAHGSAYSTAKHGLIGLTKGVAVENAAYGITCNAVCPGYSLTPTIANVKTLVWNIANVLRKFTVVQTRLDEVSAEHHIPFEVLKSVLRFNAAKCFSNSWSGRDGECRLPHYDANNGVGSSVVFYRTYLHTGDKFSRTGVAPPGVSNEHGANVRVPVTCDN